MTCTDAQPLLSERLDRRLRAREAHLLDAHLESCVACRAFRSALAQETALFAEVWPPVTAPPGFAGRVAASLPARDVTQAEGAARDADAPRRAARVTTHALMRRAMGRTVLAGAALAVALLAVAVTVEPVRASLNLLLRRVVLRESVPAEPARTMPLTGVSLEEAQRLVAWHIRLPAYLPPGYRLVAVDAGEIHTFAAGPTIVLDYARGDGPGIARLRIMQLRVQEQAAEPVAPGAGRSISVGGRPGLLIEGEWVEDEAGRQAWQQGGMVRLVFEDRDLVIQLQADPRDGWVPELLIQVAISLR